MQDIPGLVRFGCLAVLLGGCRLPSAALELEQADPPPPVFAEHDTQQPVSSSSETLPAIERGVCPGEVGDYPVPYFGDRVLIRLPVGVTDDNFIEFAPSLARLTGPVESSNCDADMPGARIEFMAMAMFDFDPEQPIVQLRDELLEAFGYPPETELVAHDPGRDAHSGMWVVDVPVSAAQPEPARALLAITSGAGIIVAVIYEVHPDAWAVIVNSLLDSANRISLLAI